MKDVFVEYMVKKKRTPADYTAIIGILLAGVVLFAFLVVISAFWGFFRLIGPAVGIVVLYLAWRLAASRMIEYEYAITNGELDIDKITAGRSRKRIVSFSCRDLVEFGRYRVTTQTGHAVMHRIFACDSMHSENLWYGVVRLADRGTTLVVFNASDRLLSAIQTSLPPALSRGLIDRGQTE